MAQLLRVRDVTFVDQIVSLDDQHFVGCVFRGCELQYFGGPVIFEETAVLGCRWSFGGAAHRTIDVLQMFGLELPPGPAPDRVQHI